MKQRLVTVLSTAAMVFLNSAAFGQQPAQDDPNPPWKAELEKKPTPRGPDGKPVLEGMWQRSGTAVQAELGAVAAASSQRDPAGTNNVQRYYGRGDGVASFINFERDNGVTPGAHRNKPLYKPEYWERVQYMDEHGNFEDPEFVCMPAGVPRMGPPDRIVKSGSNEYIFLNQTRNTIRVIPLNTPPMPYEEWEGISWLGKPTARWEGDTLVIESVDFGDQSWLGLSGYIHSNERFPLALVSASRFLSASADGGAQNPSPSGCSDASCRSSG